MMTKWKFFLKLSRKHMILHVMSKKQSTPWMTQSLLNCEQGKHRLYRLCVVSPVFKTEFSKYKK